MRRQAPCERGVPPQAPAPPPRGLKTPAAPVPLQGRRSSAHHSKEEASQTVSPCRDKRYCAAALSNPSAPMCRGCNPFRTTPETPSSHS